MRLLILILLAACTSQNDGDGEVPAQASQEALQQEDETQEDLGPLFVWDSWGDKIGTPGEQLPDGSYIVTLEEGLQVKARLDTGFVMDEVPVMPSRQDEAVTCAEQSQIPTKIFFTDVRFSPGLVQLGTTPFVMKSEAFVSEMARSTVSYDPGTKTWACSPLTEAEPKDRWMVTFTQATFKFAYPLRLPLTIEPKSKTP